MKKYITFGEQFFDRGDELHFETKFINYLEIVLDKEQKKYKVYVYSTYRGTQVFFTDSTNKSNIDEIISALIDANFVVFEEEESGIVRLVNQNNVSEVFFHKDESLANPEDEIKLDNTMVLVFPSPVQRYLRNEDEQIGNFNQDGLHYLHMPVNKEKIKQKFPAIFGK